MLFRIHALAESDAVSDSLSGRALGSSREPLELAGLRQASPRQRKLVLQLCLAMVIATLALLPLARMPWGRIAFFFPSYQTAAIVSCLITAYLMYGHFRATRAVALLHLSAGYLYTAGILVMQCLSLQGAFIQNERLLGGAQSGIWLWFFWHLAPALSVFYLAWSNYRQPGLRVEPGQAALRNTALGWLAATTATAILVFGLHDRLPVLDVAEDFSRITTTGIAPALQLILGAALLVLWRASRFRNVLHLWLGVVVVALLCDNALTMMAGSRLTIGWYAGRMGALVGLSVMTLVYLQEIKNAYLASLATSEQLAISNAKLDLEVHERSLYAEKLVQADQRKDQFLAMLAHELRNPLAPISAAANLLSLDNSSQDVVHKSSRIITRQVRHMTGLVDDLLDVSRVNHGFIALNRTQVDLRQVIADAIEQARPLVDARSHRLSVQLAPEVGCVTGDHKRLVQVVTNLLNNSAKYTPENGNISVRLDLTETHVAISVTDDGIGIAAQLLPDVFGLFVQEERTFAHARGGLGLGLGLAIVKSLVELHGGTVSAQSRGHDQGSTFTIRLPRLSMQGDCLRHAEPSPTVSPVVRSKAFVLVVDDNVDAAEMLGEFLKAKGFRVAVEHDAMRALTRAEQETFDAFFLDIGMPGMDGRDLAKRLRTLPRSTAKLMVAITGYGSEADRKSFFAAGFDEHLVKPANPEKILEMLEKIKLDGTADSVVSDTNNRQDPRAMRSVAEDRR